MNNQLENLGFYFGLRLLGFLLILMATVSTLYFFYAIATGTDTETKLVITALLQLAFPLWLFLFVLEYRSLLVRLDQTGIRPRPGAQAIKWQSIDQVSISTIPGVSFLNKVSLSSETSSASIYVGQYARPEELKRYIASHLDWLEVSQLKEPCLITKPSRKGSNQTY